MSKLVHTHSYGKKDVGEPTRSWCRGTPTKTSTPWTSRSGRTGTETGHEVWVDWVEKGTVRDLPEGVPRVKTHLDGPRW